MRIQFSLTGVSGLYNIKEMFLLLFLLNQISTQPQNSHYFSKQFLMCFMMWENGFKEKKETGKKWQKNDLLFFADENCSINKVLWLIFVVILILINKLHLFVCYMIKSPLSHDGFSKKIVGDKLSETF